MIKSKKANGRVKNGFKAASKSKSSNSNLKPALKKKAKGRK